MRINYFIIAAILFLSFNLNAQTIITGYVTDSLNKPIPSASVYLSKTTIGTSTDSDGTYSLTIPQNGVYELIFSSIGYKTYSQTLSADGRLQKINIILSLKVIPLNEVTVKSKDKNRLKNLSQFTRLFLGETNNAQSCKLINPEDLHLYFNSQTKILKGFSTKPLEIENKALGYNIIYELADFTFNTETGFLRFSGNQYFQLIHGNPRSDKKWHKNRLIAFYGSRLHLMRAIFSESLVSENFRISECKLDPVTKECLEINPITVSSFLQSHNHSFSTLYYNNPIFVKYTDNHPELAKGLTGFQVQDYESTIQFTDTLKLYPNGYFEDPYFITWGGDMAKERIADMLPFDFLPDDGAKDKSEEIKITSPFEDYLLSQKRSVSPDQIFVHLDRNQYKPGDTIYFQAYIRDRFTNDFESKSVSLYALLYDFNNSKVDSSRFKIDNSTSSGWMIIPANVNSGKYHFAAFTSIMQNFDPSEAFQTDIMIRNKAFDQQKSNIPVDNQFFEFKFLPEGGTLVKGIEQRIGFSATNYKGLPISIEGLLKTQNGIILDTLKSGRFGPGSFTCIPQSGMYVQLIKGATRQIIWHLPDPVDNTVCLSVKPVSNRSFTVDIQSDNYSGEVITVTGIMNYTQIFFQELKLDKKQRIVVETENLPSGVVQITVFNSAMRPIGDRLLYINGDKHLHFKINSSTAYYKSGQEAELAISVSDDQNNPVEGIFSIAVVDSLSGYNAEIFTPNIDNSFNFYPGLSNNLPPKVLAYGIENLTEAERDLIFMVYGWSRYKWEFSEYENPIKELVNYDFLKINIPSAQTKKISVNKLDLVALEGLRVIHLKADNSDEILLPLDSLPDVTRTVTLIPDTRNKKVLNNVTLSIPFKEEYFKSNKLQTPQQTISISEYPLTPGSEHFSIAKDVIEIPEVTITGHPLPEKKYQNIYEERYKYADLKSSNPELIRRTIFLETAIRTLANPTLISDDGVFFRQGKSFFGGAVRALIVLDGMPLYSQGWQIAKSIPMSEIASITILKGNQGRTIYGLEASGGVIFIETTFHDPTLANFQTDWRSENKNSDLLLPINIYRTNKEFYIPSKFVLENDPVFQNRSTIFWDPEIYFDGKNPVTIKYTNLKYPGTVMVTVNGASTNNEVGTGSTRYIVK
jgi:hypothetical protein